LAGRESEPRMLVQPAAAMDEILQVHAPAIEAAGIQVDIQPDLPRLFVHPTKLNMVLDNLLSNAIKAVDGQANPHILFGCDRPAGEEIFFLADNGPGIAEQDRAHVFELFTRLDHHHPGAGVGLAVVQKIVEYYQGRIWVDEGPLPGACFRFVLHC